MAWSRLLAILTEGSHSSSWDFIILKFSALGNLFIVFFKKEKKKPSDFLLQKQTLNQGFFFFFLFRTKQDQWGEERFFLWLALCNTFDKLVSGQRLCEVPLHSNAKNFKNVLCLNIWGPFVFPSLSLLKYWHFLF